MSVLACDRYGCDRIMCDRQGHVPESSHYGTYKIYNACFDELVLLGKDADIMAFFEGTLEYEQPEHGESWEYWNRRFPRNDE